MQIGIYSYLQVSESSGFLCRTFCHNHHNTPSPPLQTLDHQQTYTFPANSSHGERYNLLQEPLKLHLILAFGTIVKRLNTVKCAHKTMQYILRKGLSITNFINIVHLCQWAKAHSNERGKMSINELVRSPTCFSVIRGSVHSTCACGSHHFLLSLQCHEPTSSSVT